MQMAEHERRVEEAVISTIKMEEKLKQYDEKKMTEEAKEPREAPKEREMGATFRVPVEVEQQEMLLSWSVECREERPCCFWLNYVPAGGDESDSVIPPAGLRTPHLWIPVVSAPVSRWSALTRVATLYTSRAVGIDATSDCELDTH